MNTVSSLDWKIAMRLGRVPSALTLLLGVLSASPSYASTAHDDLRFIAAIAQVESGNNDNAVSPTGCVSAYQFTCSTWNMHVQWPISDASNRAKAQYVAIKHVHWLRKELTRLNPERTVDYYTLAVAWRFGPYACPTKERADAYANRVLNLIIESP